MVAELRALYATALGQNQTWKVFVFRGRRLAMTGHPTRLLTDVDGTTAQLGTSAVPIDDDSADDLIPRPPG